MCIRDSSKLILVKDMDEALELTNEYAPEHLIIETENYREIAERVINAGSVFLGSFSPESAGAVSYTHLDVYKRQVYS